MHTRIKSNHSSQDFHFSLMTLFKSIYWTHLKKPSPRAQPPPTGIFPHRNESKCEKCIFRLWSLWISTINDDFNSLDCKWALCRIHLKKYRSWDGPIQGADRKLSCITVHEGVAGKRLVLVIRCEDPRGQFETETTSVIGWVTQLR